MLMSIAKTVVMPRERIVSGDSQGDDENRLNYALRPQKFEQYGQEHRVAILATLALLDAQHHALGVDIGYLQRDDFGDTQPCTVGDT